MCIKRFSNQITFLNFVAYEKKNQKYDFCINTELFDWKNSTVDLTLKARKQKSNAERYWKFDAIVWMSTGAFSISSNKGPSLF